MSNLTSSHLFTQPSPDTEHTLPHFSPLALPGMPYPFFHLLPVEEIEDNEERQLKRAIELSKQTAAAEQHWSSLFGADKRRGVEPILLNPETSHPDPTPVEAPKPSVGGGKPSTLRKKEAKSKNKEAQAKNTDAARSTKRRKQTDSSNRRTSRQRTPNVVLPHSGSENDSAPQRLSFVANEEGLVLSVSTAEIGLLKHADLFFGVGTCSRCKEAIFALTHSDNAETQLQLNLHVTCPGCGTTHCQACWRSVPCPDACEGSDVCALGTCCSTYIALAFYLLLSSFDLYFLSQGSSANADSTCKEGRREFTRSMLGDIISSTSKRFVRHLRSVTRELTRWLDGPRDGLDGNTQLVIRHLFSLSIYREVIETWIQEKNASFWIVHKKTYLKIVSLLKSCYKCGLGGIIDDVPNIIRTTEGLEALVWDGVGSVTWEVDEDGKLLEGLPLRSVIADLENRRNEFRYLLANDAECDKERQLTNKLCDNISHLLLQSITHVPHVS